MVLRLLYLVHNEKDQLSGIGHEQELIFPDILANITAAIFGMGWHLDYRAKIFLLLWNWVHTVPIYFKLFSQLLYQCTINRLN